MKRHTHGMMIMIAVVLLGSCESVSDSGGGSQSTSTTIMPLGASRVEGNRPEYESFRYPLWERLVESGRDVDFVGTRYDGVPYPDVNTVGFDRDHQGSAGWTSGQIREALPGWLEEVGAPDIVLFSSPGGNDALEELPFDDAVANVNAIIDQIQETDPNVTIVIEQMAPAKSNLMVGDLADFFEQIRQEVSTIASAQTTGSSRVLAVDMFSDFSDDLLADDVHYNQAGANFVADRYFDVLEDVFESK